MSQEQLSTLAALPFYAAGRYPKSDCLRWCRENEIVEFSSREFFDRVRDLSFGLRVLDVEAEDRVAIISEPRPDWLTTDFAVLANGAVSVPIYPTLPSSQVAYILADSGAKVVVVSDEEQAAKVRSVWSELPQLKALIVMESREIDRVGEGDRDEVSFDNLLDRGHQRLITGDGLARQYKEDALAIKPDQLATIIYTSGTTGDPKGVMLTHGNVTSNILAAKTVVTLDDSDEALSFLPLSHAFERTVVMLYFYSGVTVTFAESLDTIGRDLQRVRPTVMTGVPRVFEKLHARIFSTVAEAPLVRQKMFHWALHVGRRCSQSKLANRPVPVSVRAQMAIADKVVLSKVRARLGGRLRWVVSGSAPLAVDVAEFLFSIGVPVLEGYGLTETAPVLTVNPEGRQKLGTVGPPLPHVTLRIATDGEILARGPNIMKGYYGNTRATDEVIRDGWLHTGDIGKLDADGYLTITDRKKEIIVTANGKNIAPNPIEAALKKSPFVAEAMLVGDRRPYVVSLLVPDFDVLTARFGNDSDSQMSSGDFTYSKHFLEQPDIESLFADIVERVNANLASYEQVKRWRLLPAVFSISTGELTPTLKLRRRIVVERWSSLISELYEVSK